MKHAEQLMKNIQDWIAQPDFKYPEKNLAAFYIQSISLVIISVSIMLCAVYAIVGQLVYVSLIGTSIFFHGMVITLVRVKKLELALNIFSISTLGLLTFGILSGGGIHSLVSILYPVILIFASLLLNRKSFIVYIFMCIISIGSIVYAENQKLLQVYIPDAPEFPIFISVSLMVVTSAIIIRFITESMQNNLKKARQAMQEISTQNAMLDHVGQAIVGSDMDNTIVYWNQAAADLYGWKAEEVLGLKNHDVVLSQLTPAMIEAISAALQKGDVWSGEFSIKKQDQSEVPVLGTIAPLRDEHNKTTGWIGIAANLTERKRVETSLRERESILEAVTFSAEQFIKISDWRANIDPILERLGTTIHASHAYLFEQHQLGTGERVSSLRYEWTAPGQVSDLEGGNFQSNHLVEEGFENYFNTLRNKNSYVGSASTFLPKEKDYFTKLGIKAVLEVPLFVNGQWWGTVGFDDHEKEREWSNAEVDALKIAAGILSAAIQRQETDAALHESERIYRQAIQSAGMVPYYRDYIKNEYTFVGDGIEKIIGYKPREITPQLWLDIMKENIPLGEGEGLNIDDAVDISRQGKMKEWKSDMRVLAKNGEERWLSDSSIELFNDVDLSYASMGIMQDITRRKEIEADLRHRESVLSAITYFAEQFLRTSNWHENINNVLERIGREINASHAYLFERHTDAEGNITNSLRYEWVAAGQKPDIDNPEYQNVPVRKAGFERYYQILESGEPFIGSSSSFTEIEKKNLHQFNIKAMLEMRISVDGNQWGTIGFDEMVNNREWSAMEVDVIRVAANILGAAIKRQMDEAVLNNELTERKRAEQALVYSEEKFSKAFHTIPVMMSIEDADNIFIDVNKAFIENIGFEKNEVVGRRASDLQIVFTPEDTQKAQKLLKGQDTFKDLELSFRQRSGRFFVVLMSIEKFYVNNKEYILTSALDITERKYAESEREKLIDELEAKNEELERFTYTVSHDLKSPLVTINGFLGYLEQDAASGNMERLKKDTQRIQDAVTKMQRLLNELLELSRIGRIMNSPETIPFEELAREALDIVHGQFEAKKVTVQIQPNLPAAYGDKPRLIEALQNILDNAAKYMGDQINPVIEIGYGGDEHDKSVFYIKDNGIGIAPEYHERVFGLFNKLDAKSEGTGVGLALVKRIFEIHGGRVWVKSEAGQGSIFFFTLPKSPELKSSGVG